MDEITKWTEKIWILPTTRD